MKLLGTLAAVCLLAVPLCAQGLVLLNASAWKFSIEGVTSDEMGFILLSPGSVTSIELTPNVPWIGCATAALVTLSDPDTGAVVAVASSASGIVADSDNLRGYMGEVTVPVDTSTLSGVYEMDFVNAQGCSDYPSTLIVTLHPVMNP